MLNMRDVTKVFVSDDGLRVAAVNDCSLSVEPGELVVLMGPNGSGKSTLFNVIGGQLRADHGTVVLDGQPADAARASGSVVVAHVPQNPRTLAFPEMTLAEHLLWAELDGRRARFWSRGITRIRRHRYEKLRRRYQAGELCDALLRPLRTLSGGWQQIFVFLMAAAGPSLSERQGTQLLLLLDEPVSALDVENSQRCREMIRKLHNEGRTVLLATHDPHLALEMAGRLCIMKAGKVVADLREQDLQQLTIEDLRRQLVVNGATEVGRGPQEA